VSTRKSPKRIPKHDGTVASFARRMVWWLERSTEQQRAEAERYRGRFAGLADDAEANARNYQVMAIEGRAALRASGEAK
jgi:hypothetical protein